MRRRGVIISGVVIFLLAYGLFFVGNYAGVTVNAMYWGFRNDALVDEVAGDQPWQPSADGEYLERVVRVEQSRVAFDVQQLRYSDGYRDTGVGHNMRCNVGWLLVDPLPGAVIVTAVAWPLFVLMVNAVLKWRRGRGQRPQGFEVVVRSER